MTKPERIALTYSLQKKFQLFNGLLFVNTKSKGWMPAIESEGFKFYKDIIKPIEVAKDVSIRLEASDIASMIKTLREICETRYIENATLIHTPTQTIDVLTGVIKKNKINGVQLGIRYDYDPKIAPIEWWDEALERAIPDEEARVAYYEMIGLSMIPDKRHEVSYWFTGAASSGKSTMINAVINGIHHNYNTSKLQPENWKTNDFSFHQIANKLVNISSDSSDKKTLETGMFKKLASGEDVMADVKNLTPITFIPTALLISIGNNMPKITEKTDGPFRRMTPIPMDRVLKESEKRTGMKKEIQNNKDRVLEYIINKGIKAVIEVYKRDAPTMPDISKKAVEELKDDNSSIRQWLMSDDVHRVIKGHTNGIEAFGLPLKLSAEQFNDWARRNGYFAIGAKEIWRQIKAELPKGVDNKYNLELYTRHNKAYIRSVIYGEGL